MELVALLSRTFSSSGATKDSSSFFSSRGLGSSGEGASVFFLSAASSRDLEEG